MSVSQKARAAYDKYSAAKKKAQDKYDTAKQVYETAKKLLDEDTRSEELFKQGLKYMLKLGEKLVGKSLTSHPYFAYHKIHLEALGKALTASDTHNNAMKALETAISSAESAEKLASQVGDLVNRKQGLKLQYTIFLDTYMDILKNIDAGIKSGHEELKKLGMTEDEVRKDAEVRLYEWRAVCADAYYDALELYSMVGIEQRAAAAAYKRFTDKVKKLSGSSSQLDNVAGRGAEYKRQLEWAERELNKRGSGDAVADPSLHAQRQLDKVEAVLKPLLKILDVAMSHEAYSPLVVETRIESL